LILKLRMKLLLSTSIQKSKPKINISKIEIHNS
jgi:hypothetical protein